jgi:hypothetical protein
MNQTIINQNAQNRTFYYRLDVAKDEATVLAEELSDTAILAGYRTDLPDPLLSRRYSLVKFFVSVKDPKITNNGQYPIRVYLCRHDSDDELLIADSHGNQREIWENLQKEYHLLSDYVKTKDEVMFLKDEQNNAILCLRSFWDVDEIEPKLLKQVPKSQLSFSLSTRNGVERFLRSMNDELPGLKKQYRFGACRKYSTAELN